MRFRRGAFWNQGTPVKIVGDASPWGLGAYIMIDGVIIEYFAVALNDWVAGYLNAPIGSCTGQQVWEALNLVLALRAWKARWTTTRISLEVRADSVSALTLVATLRARGPALAAIGREYALDVGDGAYLPDICCHTPGVASHVADALSRKFDNNSPQWKLPDLLRDASEVFPPALNADFFTASPAPVHRTADMGEPEKAPTDEQYQ